MNRTRMIGWGLALGLLTIPAVAMQLTDEVTWSAFDFLIAATLIALVGLGIELALRTDRGIAFRAGAALGLLAGVLLTWANLAVGILGSEDNPVNLLFFAVVVLALGGAVAARGRAQVLSWVMAWTGLAQLLVPAIGFVIWSPPVDAQLGLALLFNSVFAAMWLASAWLFRRAAVAPARR